MSTQQKAALGNGGGNLLPGSMRVSERVIVDDVRQRNAHGRGLSAFPLAPQDDVRIAGTPDHDARPLLGRVRVPNVGYLVEPDDIPVLHLIATNNNIIAYLKLRFSAPIKHQWVSGRFGPESLKKIFLKTAFLVFCQ